MTWAYKWAPKVMDRKRRKKDIPNRDGVLKISKGWLQRYMFNSVPFCTISSLYNTNLLKTPCWDIRITLLIIYRVNTLHISVANINCKAHVVELRWKQHIKLRLINLQNKLHNFSEDSLKKTGYLSSAWWLSRVI